MSIRIERLAKSFGGQPVVKPTSLEVRDGELFVLLGASGSGKSTVLRMVAGLTPPDSGVISLHGRDVTRLSPQERGIGFVFQNYSIFRHMSVGENIEFPLKIRKVPPAERARRREELLDRVGLGGFGNRYAHQLSGGQQQRVALARALVNRPRALLLDEPLGALDLRLRKQLQIELKRIQREVGITFVHVTHDQEEAMTMADTIAVMNEGRIEQQGGATDLYERPATEFVANFLGDCNLVDGKLSRRDGGMAEFVTHDGAHLRVPDERISASLNGGQVRVGVRPEKLTLVPQGMDVPEGANALRGRVEIASFLGTAIQYVVHTAGGEEFTAVEQNRLGAEPDSLGPGREVSLAWDPAHSILVAKESVDA
ncbi:MAG: spermidine/putrescine transport system ATP-binding protein [Thermoleophilaceae bacterium]|nr:spermidine/putrescine transport system ATP-binding protein [Thermoleophilaceae bacterium]